MEIRSLNYQKRAGLIILMSVLGADWLSGGDDVIVSEGR